MNDPVRASHYSLFLDAPLQQLLQARALELPVPKRARHGKDVAHAAVVDPGAGRLDAGGLGAYFGA